MTRQEVLERVELEINPFSHRPRLVVRTNTNIACRDLTDEEIENWSVSLFSYQQEQIQQEEVSDVAIEEIYPKKYTKKDYNDALKNIDEELIYVTRDKNGDVIVWEMTPFKEKDGWWAHCNVWENLGKNKKLFPSVKWEDEKPTIMQDIIDYWHDTHKEDEPDWEAIKAHDEWLYD